MENNYHEEYEKQEHLDEEQLEMIRRYEKKYQRGPSLLESGSIFSKAFFSWMAPMFKVKISPKIKIYGFFIWFCFCVFFFGKSYSAVGLYSSTYPFDMSVHVISYIF